METKRWEGDLAHFADHARQVLFEHGLQIGDELGDVAHVVVVLVHRKLQFAADVAAVIGLGSDGLLQSRQIGFGGQHVLVFGLVFGFDDPASDTRLHQSHVFVHRRGCLFLFVRVGVRAFEFGQRRIGVGKYIADSFSHQIIIVGLRSIRPSQT